MYKKWSKKENNILIQNYKGKSAMNIAVLLDRSLQSVQNQIIRLDLTKKWSDKEIKILYKFYPQEGGLIVKRFPDRTIAGIRQKIRELKIQNVNRKLSQKQIIQNLGSNKIIAKCKHHGITTYYYYQYNKRSKCIKCHREWLKKHRKSPLGNYKSRIQSSLRSYAKHQISLSKHLPYNAENLNKHLEYIRQQQNNKCPMCFISYEINNYDIDHIIPLSSASTIDQLKKLYSLNNLTLLCFKCNRFVKRNSILFV